MDKRWNTYSLEEVAKLVSGRTPEREQKEYYAKEGTPWVKIENLNQGYITETSEYLSEKGREKVNLVPKNSVLFSIVGTVGKVGIAGRELATNQQLVALIFDEEKVLPLFGYYCLRCHAEEIRKLSNQTTMALISRKTLSQYHICVPESLEEQQNIVDQLLKFEIYAKKKEKLREKFSKYEIVLFQKMFHDEIQYHETLNVREFLREPVSTTSKRREEQGEEFPGIDSQEFEKPYLDVSLKTENYRERGEKSGKRDEKEGTGLVQEGDLLLRNGKIILAEKQNSPRYIDRSILCIRTRKSQLLPEVLYAYLSLPEIKATLYTQRKEGDSRKRPIRAGELERMKIPYFTYEKQEKYGEFLRKIRVIQRSLDQETACAWKVFAGMARMLLKENPESISQEMNEELAVPVEPTVQDSGFVPESSQAKVVIQNVEENSRYMKVSHLVLAVLVGWCPQNERAGEYYGRRQEIFRMAQPYFQPAALSFVTGQGQRDYLLERDFLAYRSGKLSEEWVLPLELLRDLLKKMETGEIRDAHLAFHGENGICTEADWESDLVIKMAREGWKVLAEFSGYQECAFLF